MKAAPLLLLLALPHFASGCATQPATKATTATPAAVAARPKSQKRAEHQEMSLDGEMGVLESADIEDTMQAHFENIRACYGRAGAAQSYASGKVLLRFLVAGDGGAKDVWVIESSLGNYDVERCLVEVGREITFRAPVGGKATTFEYPVEFRSTNQIALLDIDGPKVEHDLATLLPELAVCGQLAVDPAKAILYIEPDGVPGSVGLSVAAAIDENVGACMVRIMRKWKMSAKLPNRVMRTTFTIPPAITTAEVTPPRRAGRRHVNRR